MTIPSARNRPPRRSDGERTHATILLAAARVASVEGIHGLTIGRLAESLGISKSGLYSHFRSREQLQRETIETAQAIFAEEVLGPVLAADEGLARFEVLMDRYFSYLERWVFPGGCFFASLLADADARPGPIRDLVGDIEREWLEVMAGFAREAQARGELAAGVDVDQLVFELDAAFELSNFHFVLFRDPRVLARGRRAAEDILRRARAA